VSSDSEGEERGGISNARNGRPYAHKRGGEKQLLGIEELKGKKSKSQSGLRLAHENNVWKKQGGTPPWKVAFWRRKGRKGSKSPH